MNPRLVKALLFFSDGLLESLLEQRQLGDEVGDGVHQRLLRRVVRRGLDPEDDFVLEGVGVLVAGEEHVGILQQLTPENIEVREVSSTRSTFYKKR